MALFAWRIRKNLFLGDEVVGIRMIKKLLLNLVISLISLLQLLLEPTILNLPILIQLVHLRFELENMIVLTRDVIVQLVDHELHLMFLINLIHKLVELILINSNALIFVNMHILVGVAIQQALVLSLFLRRPNRVLLILKPPYILIKFSSDMTRVIIIVFLFLRKN